MFAKPHSPRRNAGGQPHALCLLLVGAVGVTLGGGTCQASQGDTLLASFNPNFLHGPVGHQVDISRFERGNPVMAGSYRPDIYVNQNWVGRHDVRVVERPGNRGPGYCFERKQLADLGLDLTRLPGDAQALETDCFDVALQVPDVRAEFDLSGQRLDLSIPQAYMGRSTRGHVDPRDWDRGVNAAFIDYSANTFRHDGDNRQANTQHYVGLNTGMNLGHWRLRHNGSYTRSSADGATSSHYQAVSSYAQRDLTRLKSQLTLGEYYTPADLFDSVPYTGAQLASDDRMLPDSRRGFAPTIRGSADSNARVTIRQSGVLLYETTVAPGPFVIDDLYNTGYSGDLEVMVSEADGRSRSFTVPFASVAQLLRPGTSRYSVTAGRYRDAQLKREPDFVQGTYQYGMSNYLTGYTGGIIADRYQAAQAGLGLSTPLGAFALDSTYSSASGLEARDGLSSSASGLSHRVSYSKLLERTRTNFVVAAYRFSSDGYLGFADYALAQDDGAASPKRQRSRLQVNISQPLADGHGSVFLSGSSQNYWQTGRSSDISYQTGYSNSYRWGSLSLSANRARTNHRQTDTQYTLAVSLPLWRSSQAAYLSSSTTYSDRGDVSSQLSVSGALGNTNQLSYGLYGALSRSNGDSSTAVGSNVQYRAASTNLSANYSQGGGYRQFGLGMSGSVIAHPGGVTFSQTQGEPRAIVEANGAEGARLFNNTGAAVGSNGYGVVSSLMPYRQNEVALDPKGISREVELQLTSQNVAPRYGAVVMLKYPTVTGEPVLMTLRDQHGEALPMGAEVFDAQGRSITLVGQGSRVFFHAPEQHGDLTVRWGKSDDRQCNVRYSLPLPRSTREPSFIKTEATCAPATVLAHNTTR